MIEDEGRARVQRKRGEQKGKSAEEEGREGGGVGAELYCRTIYILYSEHSSPACTL